MWDITARLIEKEMLSVRIPKQLNRELTAYTQRIGISKAGLILLLIKRELEQPEIQKNDVP